MRRAAKVFMNNRSQAVRLPKELSVISKAELSYGVEISP